MSFEPGDTAPEFRLENAHPNIGSSEIGLNEVITERGGIVVFSCLHCPYVVGNISRIDNLARAANDAGMGFVAINSNSANPMYESDSAENTRTACAKGVPYPFLIDADQSVAAEWDAERTPEFYLLDGDAKLLYRGRLDDSPRNPQHATTSELDDALSEHLSGQTISNPRTESIGCSIKWLH